MKKIISFSLMTALVLITLLGCQREKDFLGSQNKNIVLDGEIKEINIYKSNNFEKVNSDLIVNFTDEKSLEKIRKVITSAIRVKGIVDISAPNYNLEVIYRDNSDKQLYLWLNEGEMGTLMEVEDTNTIYNLSQQMNKELRDLFIEKEYMSEYEEDSLMINIGDSTKFTKEEINDAVDLVKESFGFPASTLTKIYYDEEKSNSCAQSYLQYGRGQENEVKAENIIVLLTDFDVDDSGDNPVLNADSTYEAYNWILIRDSKEDKWRIDDQGY